MKLSFGIVALTMLALSHAASADASPGSLSPAERKQLHDNNREIARDRHALRHDHHDLRAERREGDIAGVKAERRELAQGKRELKRDRIERKRDLNYALKH